jgi:hypothetical protein
MKKKLKNIIPLICVEEWNFIYFFLTGQKNKSKNNKPRNNKKLRKSLKSE